MTGLKRLYGGLVAIGNSLQSPLLLVIRLFWGCLFLRTGLGKFANIQQVVEFFHSLGIPMAAFNAHLVATIETVGGICLILGFASRLITIPLIITLIIAFLTGDIKAVKMLFSNPTYFVMRDPFSFLFASVIIFVFGPGSISVDQWLKKKFFKSMP